MSEEFENEKMEQEAADWLWKTDRGLTGQEQDDLIDWLTVDARHAEAYEAHRLSWKRLDTLSSWKPEHGEHPNPDLLAPRKKNYSKIIYLIGTAVAACLTIFVMMTQDQVTSEPIATEQIAVMQTTEQKLEDDSVLYFKGNVDFEVKYSPAERRILMRSGEIYFDVSKDRMRPFIVETNGIDFRALGTAFNVRISSDSMELLVEEGTVKLSNTIDESLIFNAKEKERMITLENDEVLIAGQRAIVGFEASLTKPQIDSLSSHEVKRILAWQHRTLLFQGDSLSDIIQEFNRLNDVQLVIADPSLVDTKISGTIQSNNLEGFIRLLELGFSIHSEFKEDRVLLFRNE